MQTHSVVAAAGYSGAHIEDVDEHQPGATITVVLAEVVPAQWWEQPLHAQTAPRLKSALVFRPGADVISGHPGAATQTNPIPQLAVPLVRLYAG